MSIFIDTSAFYALLVSTETRHEEVLQITRQLLSERTAELWTTSYVVLETVSLLQHRIGFAPVLDFDDKILPLVRVEWVSASLHRRGLLRLKREGRRRLSLTDCVSFEFMKAKGIPQALALDAHFREAGFQCLP
ncbi:MAG: type II toxin-antitoxin system VapC family toxin [Deltaproteobacteria bacterium]|nr:type II toxin-antitoxin system VapC family toxin [Deltaproteobacteria bacterium]